jgi:aspartate aminotransferase-like enzyme
LKPEFSIQNICIEPICWAAAEAGTQFTNFALYAVKKQLPIFAHERAQPSMRKSPNRVSFPNCASEKSSLITKNTPTKTMIIPAADLASASIHRRRRGYVIYPAYLTRVPVFRIGCIGAIGEAEMRRAVWTIDEVMKKMGVAHYGPGSAVKPP